MEITSDFIRNILASILENLIKKKLGLSKGMLQIHDLSVKDLSDDAVQLKTEVTLNMSKTDIWKLVRGK